MSRGEAKKEQEKTTGWELFQQKMTTDGEVTVSWGKGWLTREKRTQRKRRTTAFLLYQGMTGRVHTLEGAYLKFDSEMCGE